MKKYIVVREFIDPDKEPRVIGQFETRRGLRHLLGVAMANAGCMK